MKRIGFQFILAVFLALVVSSTAQTPVVQATPTTTARSPMSMALQPRTTIVVNSKSNSGPGSLREAIENALPGDSITFDSSVFPPTNPDTITLASGLPALDQGNLVIDASDAGVVIDGSMITTPESVFGLSISSNNNIIRGFQIVGFSHAGIALHGGAQNNTIGGDRHIGTGPSGQGNMVTGNGTFGIALWSEGTSFNTIQGNVIGTDPNGTTRRGDFSQGIFSDGANYNLVVDNLIGGYVDNGVGISSVSDGHNTVRGNYIGTDPSGVADLANSSANGIAINRSSFNVVGPANVIAHNDGTGIAVFGENSEGNRITRNSIHDNGTLGIDLWYGGNTELAAPLLFDFDLQAGTVTGLSCANCTVEVFSDNTDEGAVYEGQTAADNAGIFTFNKGASFAGPHLTATATDADSNTSQFSVPTPDTPTRTVILQEGNILPKTRLQPKSSEELVDNRIGGGWDLPWILNLGVKRASISINEVEWSGVHWSNPEFDVSPWLDDYVTTLAANGLTLTNTLSFWDKANHPGGWEEGAGYSRFQTEEEIQRYLEYVQFNVNHFKDRVQYFELWNEPDNQGFPVQYIQIPDYINLVQQVVPVIRQEYPEAKIVVGSVSNLLYTQDYFFSILKSEEIMPLVDVIGWHPMYGTSPAYEEYIEYYYQYPSIVQAIKDTASAHGFSGEYYVDEIGWASYEHPPPPDQPWVYGEIQAAKYYARGIVMHLGMDVNTEVGDPSPDRVTIFATVQNLCTIMAGATPDSVPIEIQSEATNIRSNGFSLPDGDRMIALWTDGVAVDDDPGMTTTLILPDLSDQTVTGIDVLNGFQQEIITEVENGNLVIRNLMVKDYPIILSTASVQNVETGISPFNFALHQNYPNPFNPITTIRYDLPEQSHVNITIYNLLGRQVITLVNQTQDAGYKSIIWDATNVSSGMYFYQISAGSLGKVEDPDGIGAGDFTQTRKMVLLK